ncbi:PH domain-containing protein [Catellatospora sichuanensis]|uniref:PH domain-containing protein n=1 Tax=Catellatospora sichuanensis TaxID=1969805 RepID=UPI00118367CB|nr:PH domain-containing protein [Catellatospora sichuanensis]
MTRFRLPASISVAALITALGGVPLAALGGFWWLVLTVPVAVMVWAWRAGTDVNERGLRVRALLGSRIVLWPHVAELRPDGPKRVVAVLTDGTAVELTAVRPADLPALVRAAGQSLATA